MCIFPSAELFTRHQLTSKQQAWTNKLVIFLATKTLGWARYCYYVTIGLPHVSVNLIYIWIIMKNHFTLVRPSCEVRMLTNARFIKAATSKFQWNWFYYDKDTCLLIAHLLAQYLSPKNNFKERIYFFWICLFMKPWAWLVKMWKLQFSIQLHIVRQVTSWQPTRISEHDIRLLIYLVRYDSFVLLLRVFHLHYRLRTMQLTELWRWPCKPLSVTIWLDNGLRI